VRAAAAALPRIGLAEAAAILLVIERTEPENYEHTALRWLARLAAEGPDVGLTAIAHAATRSTHSRTSCCPTHPPQICLTAGLRKTALLSSCG